MNTHPTTTDSMLATALKFNDNDLMANRDGYMTKEQRVRLRRIGLSRYLPSAFGSIVFGIAFFLCLLLLLTGLRDGQLLFLLSIFGFMSVWLAGYAYVHWRKFKADLEKGNVAMAAGQIRLNIYGFGNRIGFSVGIEKQSFGVKRRILLAFKNGEPYQIYYAPHSRTLLSAEHLSRKRRN